MNGQFHMVEATYRVKEARKQLLHENGRHPDDKEIAEAAGLSMKRLAAVLMTPKAPRSLEQKIGINQNLKPSVRLIATQFLFPFLMAISPSLTYLIFMLFTRKSFLTRKQKLVKIC